MVESNDLKLPESRKRALGYPKNLGIVKIISPLNSKREIIKLVERTKKIEPINVDPRIGADQLQVEKIRNRFESFRNELSSFINQLDDSLIEVGIALDSPAEREEVINLIEKKMGKYGGEVKALIEEKGMLENRLSELKSVSSIIEKMDRLNINPEVLAQSEAHYTSILAGVVYKGKVQPLNFGIREATGDKAIFISNEYTKDENMFLLVYLKKDLEIINLKLKDAQYIPVEIPENMTLNDVEVKEKITKTEKQIEVNASAIEAFTKSKGKYLKALEEICSIEIDRINNIEFKMKRTQTQVILWGWIPPSEKDAFEREVMKVTENKAQLELKTGELDPKLTPTYTSNPPFLDPVRSIITMFGNPTNEGVDPFPFVMILFPLFFGIMFADIGHGFILAMIGYYFMQKKKKMGNVKIEGFKALLYDASNLIFIMGLSAIFFGLIIGSLFGDETILWSTGLQHIFGATAVEVNGELIVKSGILPTWTFFYTLTPEMNLGAPALVIHRNYVNFLLFSIVIGAITILIGLGLQIYQFVTNKQAKLDIASAILLPSIYFAALLFFALFLFGASNEIVALLFILAIIGLIAGMIYIDAKAHGFNGVTHSIENLIGLFSNTFSFARLLALNTIHFVFSLLPYIFADLAVAGGDNTLVNHYAGQWHQVTLPLIWLWIPMAILGSLIVVPVETMFSSLQALRLTWVEFFGKFFKGSGIPFAPVEHLRFYSREI